MTTQAEKNQRLNLRISSEALAQIKDAAALSQQDVTSFLLGAALDRARGVLAEDRVLRLSQRDFAQLQATLDRQPEVNPKLAAFLGRSGGGAAGH